MKCDVLNYIDMFQICQQMKYSTVSLVWLLKPLPIPIAIWEDINMDFIGGSSKPKGYNSILIIVDRLNKFCHFILLKHPYSAKTVDEYFVKSIVRPWVFQSVFSDRDNVFLHNFWFKLFRLQNTQLNRSMTYHPKSDGQNEVVNWCLETYLKCSIRYKQFFV